MREEMAPQFPARQAGFIVEINRYDGKGWVIVQGPLSREQARQVRRWYTANSDVKPRIVPAQ